MNVLADESVDGPVVQRLREDGRQVVYVAEIDSGISDKEILQAANVQSAMLLTADKDFGEMVYRQNLLNSAGIVLIRLAGLTSERKSEIVSRAFRDHEKELPNSFSVISAGRIRVRSHS